MRKYWVLPVAAAGIVFLGAVLWGLLASDVETPDYEVLRKSGDIEIRVYDPMIVAEAAVEGERDEAINRGFRIIADYIFGNNLSSDEVAMTAPVTQQSRESISMTAPVTQQSEGTFWNVRFVMPSKYTMETLPKPVNPEVVLIEVPAKRFAAIRFSGFANRDTLDRHTAQLREYIAEQGLASVNTPQYAFYNAPWTLPFMRRNEVMIEIAE
jgi:hypothetical protein